MSEQTTNDELLDQLLDRWEEAYEQGIAVDLPELCHDHPDLQDELRRRINALLAMDQRLKGTESTPASAPTIQYETEIQGLNFHAKGGLGSVFVGEQQRLGRRVAVKFIHRSLAADPLSRERFALEAEITSRLEHPGVIPIHGLGHSHDGRPFYAMRFIDGHTLDEAIRRYHEQLARGELEEGIGFRQLLRAFISICNTVAYAHNRGIVHRDIKPDNVMLGRYGETIVVDWGLACPVARDEHHRQSGEKTLLLSSGNSDNSSGNGAGTPAYMSPEQASELNPTPASDIYSLGATLYKILTGRPPVTGDTLVEIKTKVIEGRIAGPREIQRGVPRPLDAVCRKAMSVQPTGRYATALELAEEIDHYLADEPVTAYPEPPIATTWRWVRRNRGTTIATLGGLVACLMLAGITSFWLAHAAQREMLARRDAQQSRRHAETSRRENLGTSALFLAKSIAQEIDLRWRILEAEANSPQLRKALAVVNQSGEIEPPANSEVIAAPLQSWLERRFIANQSDIKTICWCIYDVHGTQQARVPIAGSVGRNFRHRDYFHGEGRDLNETELQRRHDIAPLSDRIVYISNVFQGANTQTLLVTFSVPIWDKPPEMVDRKKIGVLAMPVELGDFGLGSHAILVDTREDQLNHRAGLVLHHPRLGLRRSADELVYLTESDLGRALSLRQDRRVGDQFAALRRANVFENFADPLSQERLAAMEPVIIRGRDRDTADTGWVVVVTEED
jgi:serine/threonine-protein kinase